MNSTGLRRRVGAVVLLIPVAAGCSSGSSGPGVAHIGGSGTPSASASATPNALAYAQCMRAHGVPSFPDPNSNGTFDLRAHNVDRNAPQFQHAAQACQSLRPPTIGQRVAQDQPELLKFSACMRENGEPKFPDIGSDSTRRTVADAIRALDPSSPTFQNALNKCRALLPADLSNLGGGTP